MRKFILMTKLPANFFSTTTGVLLALVIMLAGCTATTALTRPNEVTSLVTFTKQLRSDTSAGLDNSIGAALREANQALKNSTNDARGPTKLDIFAHQEVNSEDYIAIATWWCPRHQKISDAKGVSNKYGEVCMSRGGNWRAPYCENSEGKPLFFAMVKGTPSFCSGGYPTAAVSVIEPKGSLDANGYISALRAEGYRTAKDQARDRQMDRQQQVAQSIETERVRTDAQEGSMICNNDGAITTVAFVEAKRPDGKLRLRLHNIYRSSGAMAGVQLTGGRFGNVGQIVYEDPNGWYFCSRKN